jgi:cytochrome c-type biogenesis protein CcmH/NrfG
MNDESTTSEEVADAVDPVKPKNQGLGWRPIIGLLALIIIGVLVYQSFKEQSPPIVPASGNVSPVATAQVTTPVVTTQANPDSAQAQFDLGNTYAAAEQWEQAQAAYQKAIELDPNFQSAYANLGVVYYQLEKLDLAASQYQKALELKPDDGDVAYNLGALYLQQALLNSNPPNPELVKQAIDQLQHAIELDPDLAEPYFSLGVAYNTLNQKEEAIKAFKTFLSHNDGKDARAAQEAQRYLDTLRSQ